ncbi:hypothetical protein HZA98_02315 [Candidatus Woesearchaeota archaeon]|nr:hypothetical protein [Candidatus Woesearchaeota archaeon]
MEWKTWSRLSGVILFIIAIAGFYYAHLYHGSSKLEIQNFPSETDLDSLNPTQDISFSFFLYNTGEKTAFVKSIILLEYDEQGKQKTTAVIVSPKTDFAINSKESREINVTLPSPQKEIQYSLSAQIYYDNNKINSETVPVRWGGLL